MAIDKKISTLIPQQVPGFVLEDHPNFVAFLEAYYEYLEQNDASYDTSANIASSKTVARAKKMLTYRDVDQTIDVFGEKLYNEFLSLIPKEARVNKDLLVKNIKDFYRARGTEKSIKFLFRILFGEEAEIYYPKRDVLIASSGKWIIERSLRVTGVEIDGVPTDTINNLQPFENTMIVGEDSNASAFIEKILISYENNIRIIELFFSNRAGEFIDGETVTATNKYGSELTAMIFSGQVVSITLTNSGTRYNVGDPLIFESNTGTGAAGYISEVSTGSVENVTVIRGGAGFRTNNIIQFTGGGGSGANVIVGQLDGVANSHWHPNTMNINSDEILLFANTVLNVANYAFPNFPNVNANTDLINALSMFAYGPIAPLAEGTTGVILVSGGNNYTSVPSVDIYGNTRIKVLGILGRMKVNDGGSGYTVGNIVRFTNQPGTFGVGANAAVVSVNGTGSITHIQFTANGSYPIGGFGYEVTKLPTANVSSNTGTGANVEVSTLLGYGVPKVEFEVQTGEIGSIINLTLTNQGQGYRTAPTINLTTQGDGEAQAYSNIVSGSYTYPGRYLDDTGFPSSYNFLQDRDYYQNFSYVVKVKKSLSEWSKYVKTILHPAGMKYFGEYLLFNDDDLDTVSNISTTIETSNTYTVNAVSYASGYLRRSNVMANATKQGTVSLWMKMNSVPQGSNTKTLLVLGNLTVSIANTNGSGSKNYVQILGKDHTGNTVLDMRSNVSTPIVSNNWIHVIGSWDLSNSTGRHLYITDVPSINVITYTNSNVALNIGNNAIAGNYNGNNRFDGCLAEVYFANSFNSLSNSTVRRVFLSTKLEPVLINTSPILYLNGSATTVNTNMGTGGNFIANGTLIDCENGPNFV